MMERRPLVGVGRKVTNRICDKNSVIYFADLCTYIIPKVSKNA